MDFSLNQAINMIWYFSDKKTNTNNKIITDRKIKEIFTLANDLKEKKTDIQKIELYDLLGIYKSKLYDSRIEMLQRQKGYIYKTLFSICGDYNIKISDSNYEEFENEIKYYLLTVIDRTSLNNYGQIIKYMDLTVKGYFRTYLKKYQKQNGVLSLDAARYSTKDGKEKARMEYIANPNSLSKKEPNNSFSTEMFQALSTLSEEDLSFIMLKYQENYSTSELETHFNLTNEELEAKEMKILSMLKNNDKVKVLNKKK